MPKIKDGEIRKLSKEDLDKRLKQGVPSGAFKDKGIKGIAYYGVSNLSGVNSFIQYLDAIGKPPMIINPEVLQSDYANIVLPRLDAFYRGLRAGK